jgi:alpha-methylacyl-CoA racemase
LTDRPDAPAPPLAGLTVVDLTRLLPGPLATQRLVAWGATVVKVEDPGEGDGMRALLRTDDDARAGRPSALYRALNAGKTLRRLDLRHDDGRAALRDLLAGADALVEGFRPGVMARLGFGWPEVHALNPRLVMVSISGYGQSGPGALRAGHDINYIAEAGLLWPGDHPADAPPALPNFQIADLLGGTQAALNGLLAALWAVQRGQPGRHVDVSMTDEVRRHAVFSRHEAAAAGTAAGPAQALLNGGAACYGLYRCADGAWLAVGALEAKFWQALCRAVGREDLATRHWSRGEVPGSAEARAWRWRSGWPRSPRRTGCA